ncbi:MAG: TauD/TfdA family dioxygenase [Alphaproteobacteria bacterium]|nr:TauD/TfdA family dioxygenase [Alphaproteobacteria bacterium]
MAKNFDTRPLSSALGAEILGLDLTRTFDTATTEELAEAWTENILLLFRKPDLDQGDHLRLAACFGRIGERPRPKEQRPEDFSKLHPAFMLISNIRENGKPIGSLPDGEMMFHHDTIYKKQPHLGTMLYAIEVPSTGGNTKFNNCYKAWDALPAAIQTRVVGHKAFHAYDYETIDHRQGVKPNAHGTLDSFWHPVVITHPRSGRRALYVDRLMTQRIDDLPQAESDAILATMFDVAERPEFVYEHVWTPGDLLLWDNLCSAHARTDFSINERRLLRRIQIEADAPPAA